METINVIYVEPGKKARIIEMENKYSEMKKLVGGHIEQYMPFEDDVAIICNEEGKINGMPLNRAVFLEYGQLDDIIAGPFFITYVALESEKYLSLPKELEEKYIEKFKLPEEFYKTTEGILSVPYEPENCLVEW